MKTKGKVGLILGIVAIVLVIALLIGMLTQCNSGKQPAGGTPSKDDTSSQTSSGTKLKRPLVIEEEEEKDDGESNAPSSDDTPDDTQGEKPNSSTPAPSEPEEGGTPLKNSFKVPTKAITGNYEVGTTTEIALTTAVQYNNPYTEVAVNAVFEGPEGQKRTVPAFWDGGDTWKIRFSPDMVGEWKFTTNCTDATNTGLNNRTGTFTAKKYTGDSAVEKHGRLRVSDDKETLTYGDGTPFFWLADTSWFGMSMRQKWEFSNKREYESMYKAIIDARAASGYNTYQVTFYLDGNISSLGNEGGIAYHDGTNFEQVNPEYWQYCDLRIQYCVEKGIIPVIGFGWGGSLKPTNYEKFEGVARYVLARYASYPVVWFMFGEFNVGTDEYLCGRLGQYMNDNDPFNNVITIHASPFFTQSNDGTDYAGDYFRGQTWYDFVMSEGGHHKNWDYKGGDGFQMLDDWEVYEADGYKLPWLEAEAKYEEIWEIPANQTREVAYLAVMNGSIGYSYGAEGLWQATWNSDDTFQTYGRNPTAWFNALPKEIGSKHMTYFYNFFTSVPWWKLEHDTETVEFTYKDYPPQTVFRPTVSTDANKDWLLVYYPMDSIASNFMSLGEYSGVAKGLDPKATYTAYWYNTSTGKQIAISDSIKVNADGTYTLPMYENIKKSDAVFVMKKNGAASLKDEMVKYANSQDLSVKMVTGEKALPAVAEPPADNIEVIDLDHPLSTQGENNIYYYSYNAKTDLYKQMVCNTTLGPMYGWGDYVWGVNAGGYSLGTEGFVAGGRFCSGPNEAACVAWIAPKDGSLSIDAVPFWHNLYQESKGITWTMLKNDDILAEFVFDAQGYNSDSFKDTIEVKEGDRIIIRNFHNNFYGTHANQASVGTTLYFTPAE